MSNPKGRVVAEPSRLVGEETALTNHPIQPELRVPRASKRLLLREDFQSRWIAEQCLREFVEQYLSRRGWKRALRFRHLIRSIGYRLTPKRLREVIGEIVTDLWLDPAGYLQYNPDVLANGCNPIEHYFLYGWKEGRRASHRLDPGYYLETNPQLCAREAEPLLHYWLIGRHEGRSPIRGVSAAHADSLTLTAVEARCQERSRVCFYCGEPYTPGQVYRVERLAELLPETSYDVRIFKPGEEQQLLKDLFEAAFLWIWRTPLSDQLRPVIDEARRVGATIHFDIDDLMVRPELADPATIDGIRSMNLDSKRTARLYTETKALLLASDQASAPTSTLVRELRRFRIPTMQIPNGFSSEELIRSREARSRRIVDGKFRIGYACGSKTHQKDFRRVVPALVAILERYPETWITTFPEALVLDEFRELDPFRHRIEARKMVPLNELVLEYARFDVNLAPLETGNPFCEAKSELKFFEAALAGTPTIASPTQPFREAIRPGENGLLANNSEEWESAIESIVADPRLGRKLAANALRDALWTFGPFRRRSLLRQAVDVNLQQPEASAGAWSCHFYQAARQPRLPKLAYKVLHHDVCHHQSRVTVVVPVFNYAQFVVLALDSVARQTLQDIDLVIVDDCSTDQSLDCAERWVRENRERFGSTAILQTAGNSKLGAARNCGVDFSETEFFFPLDPDNWLKTECLERCLSKIERSAAAFVYPDLEVIGNDRQMNTGLNWHPLHFTIGNYIDAMALMHKSVWSGLGGYTNDPDLLGWEDFDFWCRVVEAGMYGERVPRKLAVYRIHDESMLKTTTDKPEFKQRLRQKIKQLHPWLDLHHVSSNTT